MKKGNNLIKVYSGTESLVNLLKSELEENGISALSKNDFPSAYLCVVPPVIDLFIQESDLKEAEQIIGAFIRRNKD